MSAHPGSLRPSRQLASDSPLRHRDDPRPLHIFMKIWCQSVLSQPQASPFSTFVQRG